MKYPTFDEWRVDNEAISFYARRVQAAIYAQAMQTDAQIRRDWRR
jgi:hypothetical protein